MGKVLIEQLRASIRALEQVPVTLATTPAPGTALLRPPCSLPLVPQLSSPSLTGRSSNHRSRDNDGQGLPDARWSLSSGRPKAEPVGGHDTGTKDVPLSRLQEGGLHQLKPESYRDTPAALGFALSVIAEAARVNRRGLALWCLTRAATLEWGRPYGPGLMRFGLDPAYLLIIEAWTAGDAAWALEEGLKSGALIAALAQIEIKTPLAARRLGLAAKASRTPCLLLSGHGGADFSSLPGTGLPGVLTRWRIASGESRPAPFDGSAPGAASWRLTLERCRGAAPGQRFRVEFSHESDRLRVAAAASDREAEKGESGSRRVSAG